MTKLMDQLNNRKINKVISIDDENALPTIDSLDSLVDAIASARTAPLRALEKQDVRFAQIVAKARAAESADRQATIRADIETLIETEKLGGDDYKKIAEILYYGHQGKTAKKLTGTFSNGTVEALSFAQWKLRSAELLQSASPAARLLLLVDERNESEKSIDLNGKRLLLQLWLEHGSRMANVDTIIITSACEPDGEFDESRSLIEELRSEISDAEIRGMVRRVFVISKRRLDAGNLSSQFEMHLDRIEAADLRSQLADLTKQALHDAVAFSLQWLEDMPLPDFHGSVFVSSENEGSSEIDTLLRLVSIRQRGELAKQMGKTGPLQEKISQMRRFSLKHLDPDFAKSTHKELRELRELEFEKSGTLLNSIMLPLSCGDVFKLTASKAGEKVGERFAVLLINPCDLTLRSNGRRKSNRGWLVPLRKDSRKALEAEIKSSGEGATLLYRLFTGSADDDVGYLFSNANVDAIDLSILDLCWTNVSGLSTLDGSTLADSKESLLVAQKNRILAVAKTAAAGSFRDIELFGTTYTAKRTPVAKITIGSTELDTRIEYPIVRAFSLSPEFAAAALTALSQSIARPAFGHDFVRLE